MSSHDLQTAEKIYRDTQNVIRYNLKNKNIFMFLINRMSVLLIVVLAFMIELIGQEPLFPNSVTSNDIDFILDTDPDSFDDFAFLGLENKETPGDPNGGGLFDINTFVFQVSFTDGEILEVWCHSSFGSQAAAQEYVEKLGPRLGKLPAFQRNMINHVVIHKGNGGAFAEIEGQFFILYSDNMDQRISTNDLEETVFHESVHASFQFMYENSPEWTNAQTADASFVTEYGEEFPQVEDMAESALFAYAYLKYPGRLSTTIEDWLEENNPNRLEFFGAFYDQVSSLVEVKNSASLIVSPNPSNSHFTMRSLNGTLNGKASLFNIQGKLIKTFDCSDKHTLELDLSDIENGLYIFSIEGHENAKLLKHN